MEGDRRRIHKLDNVRNAGRKARIRQDNHNRVFPWRSARLPGTRMRLIPSAGHKKEHRNLRIRSADGLCGILSQEIPAREMKRILPVRERERPGDEDAAEDLRILRSRRENRDRRRRRGRRRRIAEMREEAFPELRAGRPDQSPPGFQKRSPCIINYEAE